MLINNAFNKNQGSCMNLYVVKNEADSICCSPGDNPKNVKTMKNTNLVEDEGVEPSSYRPTIIGLYIFSI